MAAQKSSSVDSETNVRTTSFLPEEVDLGDDLLAEIILRLPLNSVARARAVSKSWCATISDGYLRRRLPLHMSMICFPDNDNDDPLGGAGGSSRPVYACADEGRRLVGRDLGFFPLHESAVVCDGCNGLLLCRDPAGTPGGFYVLSPVTRSWAALPMPAKDARLSLLAFDPFGTSPQQYHVINFTGWREHGAAVEVFSSGTRAWTAHEVGFGGVPAGSLSGASMHCHDGAVYFLACDPDCVVRMDLAARAGLACTVVALPEPVDAEARVGHSGGRLHYFCSDGELLRVWSLEDAHPSSSATASSQQWRLKHAVRVGDVVEGSGEVRFLAMHPEKDAVVYLWSPWKVVEYDLSRREVTGAAWEFGKGARNRVVKTWLVPSSCYLSDCFSDDGPVAP